MELFNNSIYCMKYSLFGKKSKDLKVNNPKEQKVKKKKVEFFSGISTTSISPVVYPYDDTED